LARAARKAAERFAPHGSVVVVGCARSCAPHLDQVLNNIDRLCSLYADSAVVIFENDSTDDTASRLAAYVASRPKAHLLTQNGLAAALPDRTKRLAAARNACLEFVRRAPYHSYDELLVIDFDEVNQLDIDLGQFTSARAYLQSRADLHGVFANAQPFYYDIWALRHADWSPGDCLVEFHANAAARPDAFQEFVHRRTMPLDPTAAPIDVRSAFGGLGLYRMRSALAGTYEDPTPAGGIGQCEHVRFHETILAAKGGTFAIYPALVNRTPWEHVLAVFAGRLRPVALTEGGATIKLTVPAGYPRTFLRRQFPLYQKRFPVLARLLAEARPGANILDAGAEMGDMIALCRLAGCGAPITAVEPSLNLFKLLMLNLERCPLGAVHPVWAFAGGEQVEALIEARKARALVERSEALMLGAWMDRAPITSLADLAPGAALVRLNVAGFETAMLDDSLEAFGDAPPLVWMRATSDASAGDAAWRARIEAMAARWPRLAAFDNSGLCLLAGEAADQAAACATLISLARRYRSAARAVPYTDVPLRDIEIAFFPEPSGAVFDAFCAQLPELDPTVA